MNPALLLAALVATAEVPAYEREYSGGPVTLTVRVDRTNVRISDPVSLEQILRIDAGFAGELPAFDLDEFQGFVVVDQREDEPRVRDGQTVLRRQIELETERSGTREIPSFTAYFHREGEAKESHIITEAIPIEVAAIPGPNALEIGSPRGPFTGPDPGRAPFDWKWIALGAIVVAGLVLFAVRTMRRRGPRAAPPIPAHEKALEALRRLVGAELIEKGQVEAFFVALSTILRIYIEERFGVRAPERTTEEFLAEAAAHPALEPHRVRLGGFLTVADQVKFARWNPEDAEIQSSFDIAKQFILETIADEAPDPETLDARRRTWLAAAVIAAAAFAWGLWVWLDLYHPWLLLGAIPLLPALVWALFFRSAAPAIRFPTVAWARGVRRTWRQRIRCVAPGLTIIAVALLVIAAARPRKGIAKSVIRRQGIAIQMVLDRSGSMDEKVRYRKRWIPKIDVVKSIFQDFVLGEEDLPGRKTDLIGLTTFARFAETNCPLVARYEPLVAAVENLQTVPPFIDKYRQPTRERGEAVAQHPLNRTAIGDGLQRAVLSLITAEEDLERGGEEKSYRIKGKVAIVLTDGQNNSGLDPVEAGRYAEANDIRTYFIVLFDDNVYEEGRAGPVLRGKRDPREIEAIMAAPREAAELTEGKAYRAADGDELREVYREIDQLERSEIGRMEYRSYREQYHWFLVPAVGLLVCAFFLGETIFRRAP